MKTLKRTVAVLYLIAGAIPAAADAAVVVTFAQVGRDVVATAAGTLDLTGLTNVGMRFTFDQGVNPDRPYVGTGAFFPLLTGYQGFDGPASFGSGGFIAATSQAGDPFAFNGRGFGSGVVFVNPFFVSGGTIASSARFANQTIAGLGLRAGTYNFTSATDSVIFEIESPFVPEPATWAMMIGGFGVIGGAMRRRREAATLRFA